MDKSTEKWIARQKECEVLENGEMVVKKITWENVKAGKNRPKEIMDLSVKILGGIALFLPLFLLYLQRQNEVNNERRKALTQVFTELNRDLTVIERNDIIYIDSSYWASLEKLRNDYPAKFMVYSATDLSLDIKKLYYLKSISTKISLAIFACTGSQQFLNAMLKKINTASNCQDCDPMIIKVSRWARDSASILGSSSYNRYQILSDLNKYYGSIHSDYNELVALDSSYKNESDSAIAEIKNLITFHSVLLNIKESVEGKISTKPAVADTVYLDNYYFSLENHRKMSEKANSFISTYLPPFDKIYEAEKKRYEKQFLQEIAMRR